jgi:hypothetical protein
MIELSLDDHCTDSDGIGRPALSTAVASTLVSWLTSRLADGRRTATELTFELGLSGEEAGEVGSLRSTHAKIENAAAARNIGRAR